MRRINTPDGLYHNADPVAGDAGTIVTAEALNSLQEEIVAVILAAGVALDPADNAQLLAAIQAITGAGVTWGAVKNKPETATRWPVWDEVSGKPALASAVHTHDWSEVNFKPETATRWPAVAEVTGLQDALGQKADARPTPYFFVGAPGNGYVRLNQSAGTTAAGWIGFFTADNVRRGYIGNTHDGYLEISGEGNKIAIHGDVVTDGTLQVASGLIKSINNAGAIEGQWIPTSSADYYYFANTSNAGLYSSSAGYAWGWNYASRTLTVYGMTISRGGFDSSDARLKRDIQAIAARPLHRGIALHTWHWLADNTPGIGGIAQQVQEVVPEYVTSHPTAAGDRLAIDKAGLAFEQALWSGTAIDQLHKIIHTLTARLDALESRA